MKTDSQYSGYDALSKTASDADRGAGCITIYRYVIHR